MKTRTAQRIAAIVLNGSTVLAIGAAVLAPAPAAHADVTSVVTSSSKPAPPKSYVWTKADKKLMKAANHDCRKITDDVTYEFCVIGDFHLSYSGPRVITSEDYTYNAAGRIVLVQSNGKVA